MSTSSRLNLVIGIPFSWKLRFGQFPFVDQFSGVNYDRYTSGLPARFFSQTTSSVLRFDLLHAIQKLRSNLESVRSCLYNRPSTVIKRAILDFQSVSYVLCERR